MGKAIRAQVRIILPDIGAFDPMPQTKHPSNAPQLLSSVTVARLPARQAHAHKGDFGHVLVVGGDLGTGGAVLLSAEAALRCGAGLVSVATRPEHVSASLARLPEVMCLGVRSANQLMGVLERASVLVVGPGLGQAAWGCSLLSAVANAERPQVWDADALNLLARTPLALPSGSILTPHPGRRRGCWALPLRPCRPTALALRASWRGVITASVYSKGLAHWWQPRAGSWRCASAGTRRWPAPAWAMC